MPESCNTNSNNSGGRVSLDVLLELNTPVQIAKSSVSTFRKAGPKEVRAANTGWNELHWLEQVELAKGELL